MKRKWIIPVVFLLIVLLLAGVYVTRNQWTAYAMRRMVTSQSNGQIVLDFTKTEVDVFSRTLSIYSPELTFRNVYFNKAHGSMLKKAEFHKLVLINISLWDFIAHHQFICDNLTIEKPSFILGQSQPGTKTGASSFDPGALINVLQEHEITHLNFRFLIRHTQINFGKISFSETKGKKVYGSARYNMAIENMGTIKASGDTLRPLEFEKLELSVRALHRHFTTEHTDIKLDSAFYSSRNSSLFVNGLQVVSSGKAKNKIPESRLFLRWAKISGLKTEKQKKTGKKILQLNNIKVVGGSYTFRIRQRKQEKKSVSRLINNLFASYNILSLDSLSLKHVHLFEVGNKQDTILKIKRINLEMNKIWTTKNILTNPIKSLHYQNLTISCRTLNINDSGSRLFVRSGIARYASKDNQLFVNNLSMRTQCKTDTSSSIFFSTDKLTVDSLSDKAFQKGKPQLLAIGLNSPQLIWKKDSTCQQKPITLPGILSSFQITKVNIRNGNFAFESNRNLKLNIAGIHLFANGLQGTLLRGPDAAIHYDSLFYHSNSSQLSIANTGLLLKTKALRWRHHTFRVTGLRFLQTDSSRQDTLIIRSVTLTKPKLNPLIFDQKLVATGAFFYRAHFSQSLHKFESRADTLPVRHWNSFVRLPFKTDIGYVRIRKSSFILTSRNTDKNFSINSQLDMKLYGFKMGFDTARMISQPKHWRATLRDTKISQNNLTAQLKKTDLNSDSGTLQIQNIALRQIQDSTMQFRIDIPKVNLSSLNFSALMRSDSLVFGKAIIQQAQARVQLNNFDKNIFDKAVSKWAFVYDSITLNHMLLRINIQKNNSLKMVNIDNMNLLYHPNLLHRNKLLPAPVNLIKTLDFNINEATYSDIAKKFYMVADRIALQSAENRLNIKRVVGSNFSALMLHPDIKNIYTYFLINNISLNSLRLSSGKNKYLSVKSWTIPGMWVSIIDNDTTKKKRSLSFLSSNFFSQYTHILHSIHVDSSSFRNVNFSYRYDNMSKLINIKRADINLSNIQLGNSPFGKPSDAPLFGNMLISLNDRAIVSGDSMYTFRTKDIRVNLADRKISLDSITVTPRYSRNDFFAKAGYQTDRITLYGKSAVLDGFNPADLLNNHLLHFGKLRLNNLSLRFERNMHYPRRNIIKPMPIDMLEQIPYRFRIDSVQLYKSMISYFEYEVISKNPGVFFIDNFNVLAENVTNDLPHIDSNMVLKFHGSGKLMKQANLDFTLVMPYFAPHRQWWFSAEAGQIDLTQFNLLTENVLGLTVRSGKGSLEVPLITGNDSTARGTVNFLYRKLKLRLYNRVKSEKSRKFYSPFANFVMNSLVINSNNPPFLGRTKKGIVYYERIPQRSFIGYLWKSNLSGILSTLGFNNKQQREGKREDKKQIKSENKNKPKSIEKR